VPTRKPGNSPPPLTGEGQGGGDSDGDIKAFHFCSPLTPPLSREGRGGFPDGNYLVIFFAFKIFCMDDIIHPVRFVPVNQKDQEKGGKLRWPIRV
jgi:hypothetical protein